MILTVSFFIFFCWIRLSLDRNYFSFSPSYCFFFFLSVNDYFKEFIIEECNLDPKSLYVFMFACSYFSLLCYISWHRRISSLCIYMCAPVLLIFLWYFTCSFVQNVVRILAKHPLNAFQFRNFKSSNFAHIFLQCFSICHILFICLFFVPFFSHNSGYFESAFWLCFKFGFCQRCILIVMD